MEFLKFNHSDASALVALGLHALQHRGQEGCGIVSDGKITIQKKDKVWLVIILLTRNLK